MNLEARKISLVKEFLNIDNEAIISAIENLISSSQSKVFEEGLSPMSTEAFNKEIDKAIEDEEKARLIHAEDLKKKIEKWI